MSEDEPSVGLPGSAVASGRPPGRRRLRRIGLAGAGLGLAVLLVGLALLPIGRPPGEPGGGGTGDPSAGRPGTGVLIGSRAPEFPTAGSDGQSLLTGLDGSPIRLADYQGRPLWIVFWATWCTPCQQEAGAIRELYQAHRDDDLAVLAIDVREPTATVREYARRNGLDYPIGLDPTAAVQNLYGQLGLPGHIFVDDHGVIRDRSAGQLTQDLMDAHLATILGAERQP